VQRIKLPLSSSAPQPRHCESRFFCSHPTRVAPSVPADTADHKRPTLATLISYNIDWKSVRVEDGDRPSPRPRPVGGARQHHSSRESQGIVVQLGVEHLDPRPFEAVRPHAAAEASSRSDRRA